MAEPMTPERLAEIDARRLPITPGPWRTYRAYKSLGVEIDEDGPMLFIETGGVTYAVNPADAEFVAHAPQDIADLRAEVDRLRAQVAAVEAVCRRVTLDGFETAYVSSIRAALASDG